MKWTAVVGVLGKVAPTLASVAGGPLAGAAVASLESACGLNKPALTATLAERQSAIGAALGDGSPETLLALKNADNDFKAKMAALGFEDAEALAKLAADDTANARAREIAVRDGTPRLLAGFVTLGFFGLLGFMCLKPIPADSKTMLDIMVGSLGSAWVSIISFYFGSSSGSERKTELMAGQK